MEPADNGSCDGGFVFAIHPRIAVLPLSGLLVPRRSNPAASSNTDDWERRSPPRSREVSCLVNPCFRAHACITRLMTLTDLLLEPLVREPIGLLTQSTLEKCHE
jgi:hypothetical protein